MDTEKMMLMKRIDNLCERLEKVERERDALMYDLEEASPCFACKAFLRNGGKCHGGHGCIDDLMRNALGDKVGSGWEWRGLCKENGGIEG